MAEFFVLNYGLPNAGNGGSNDKNSGLYGRESQIPVVEPEPQFLSVRDFQRYVRVKRIDTQLEKSWDRLSSNYFEAVAYVVASAYFGTAAFGQYLNGDNFVSRTILSILSSIGAGALISSISSIRKKRKKIGELFLRKEELLQDLETRKAYMGLERIAREN